MRTQTILLVRDTVVMLSIHPTDGVYNFPYSPATITKFNPRLPDLQAGIWRQSCDELVNLLDTYSQSLLFNLRRFQELGDNSGAGMIRSSCVDCLAHLAVLCQALSNAEHIPRTELDALCDSTLERLGELAQDMCMEEYTRLDLLLRVRIIPW